MLTFAVPNRGVEQSVARRAHNPEVAGSSPASATNEDKSKDLSFFCPFPDYSLALSDIIDISGW